MTRRLFFASLAAIVFAAKKASATSASAAGAIGRFGTWFHGPQPASVSSAQCGECRTRQLPRRYDGGAVFGEVTARSKSGSLYPIPICFYNNETTAASLKGLEDSGERCAVGHTIYRYKNI